MKKILLVLAMCFAFINMAFAAVNLNTATKEELDAIKGIGPVKAQAIIDYRTKNGPFMTVDALKNVNGFGDKTVDKMRSEISVGGPNPPNLAEKAPKKEAVADKKSDKKADKKAEAKDDKKADAKDEKKLSKEEKKAAKQAEKDAKKAKKEAAEKPEAAKK
jgi:competence protein ComEA